MKFISFRIELWGFLSITSFFLSFWIKGKFWNFLSTGILFFLMAILEHFVKEERELKKKSRELQELAGKELIE